MTSEEWSQRSDRELAIAALIGNLEAFGQLVRRFRPAVTVVVGGILNSRESIEDVVQDTFLLAFKALPKLKDMDSFAAWLHSIARNRAIRYKNRENRTVSRSILDISILKESDAWDVSPHDPESILEREESCREVQDVLNELPPAYQIALRLQYWGEMSINGIAEFLDIPESAVKWRIHKGKKLFRKRLEERRKEEDNAGRKTIERHSPNAQIYTGAGRKNARRAG